MYSESTECTGTQTWGDLKLGRLPRFVYDDAKEEMESPLNSAGKGVSDRMNLESSQDFKEQYNNALQ